MAGEEQIFLKQQDKILNTVHVSSIKDATSTLSQKQAKSPLKPEALANYERDKSLYLSEAACFGCHGIEVRAEQ